MTILFVCFINMLIIYKIHVCKIHRFQSIRRRKFSVPLVQG